MKMWGEIQEPSFLPDEQIVDISDVIQQAQHPQCLSNYEISSRMNETREVILPTMDPRLLYAAGLHSYKASMSDIIKDAELAVEFNLVLQKTQPDSALPEKLHQEKQPGFNKLLNFIEKQHSDFTRGIGKDPPYISEESRKIVEQKCVATILAHLGFKSADSDALDTLSDILEVFLKNICQQLRLANDSELSGRPTAFPDIVEQVLTESGIGGLKGIHDFYENRINRYEAILEKRCNILSAKHKKLITPGTLGQEVKTEKTSDGSVEDGDIPEVHFTAVDGEGDYLQPFLESGFQMLNSLEEGQFIA